MGKGFNNYMCKKFFHPASRENLKRVWMAQQKHDYEKKKQDDMQNQYQKEQEIYAHRALLGDTKAKLGLSFMYDAPAGTKNHEKEEGEPEYKFEWQGKYKAPREAYLKKDDDTIQDQPFGIEVRNIRCIKCRKWGHMNTDKICPLFKESLTAEPPQPKDQENDLLRDLQEDGLRLKQIVMGRKNNPAARNQQIIESDDEDLESQFLKSLSEKQKKKLLKKIEKLQSKKKKKKKSHGQSNSDECPEEVISHRSPPDSHKYNTDRHGMKNGQSSRSHHYDRSPSPVHKQNNRSPDRSRRGHHSPSPKRMKLRRSKSPQNVARDQKRYKSSNMRRSESQRPEYPVERSRNNYKRSESPVPKSNRNDSSNDDEMSMKQYTSRDRKSDSKKHRRRDSSDSEDDRQHMDSKMRKTSGKHNSPPKRKQSTYSSRSPEHRRR